MPRHQSERLWLAGAVVVAVVMALIGYFLLIGPQRNRTAAVRKNLSATSFQETTLQARIAGLTAQSKRISTYRAALANARQALPAATDLTATPKLLRSLADAAAATSTKLTDLTVGDPAPVTPATPTAPTTTASGSATPAASAPTAATPTLSSIAVGLTVTGTAARLNQFLADLQTTQPRALWISAMTLAPAAQADAAARSLKLTMTAFVRPAGA